MSIRVTDHYGCFEPLEMDGVVCYTRLFLESVFRQHHEKVIVNIHFYDRKLSVFKDSNGYTNQKSPGYFEIVIFSGEKKAMLTSLSHELIHVKQHMEDGFKIDRAENKIYWEDKFYMPLSDLVRMHREKQVELYRELPWEFEANLILPAILEVVTNRFDSLVKNDFAMKRYLEMALRESSYDFVLKDRMV